MDINKMLGLWFHSHEEDQKGLIVYRGRSYDFPRSRAPRGSLTIKPDGTVLFGGPGPADKSESAEGTWKVSGDLLILSRSGGREIYEVRLLEDELMRLHQQTSREVADGED